jgi:DNA-binding response OmpR family regulator
MTKQVTIFLLEDNAILTYAITEIIDIERPQYKLVTCNNGTLAWDDISKNYSKYDIIVLDNMVPGISGMEILKKIRADGALCHLPVIMQSGKLEEYAEQSAIEVGASKYLTKPYSLHDFIDLVDNLLISAKTAPESN